MQRSISTKISIVKRFQRSTNLGADLIQNDILDGFVLQRNTVNCLDSMARYVLETSQRAFTWTGSYGSGKSSLALFLCNLMSSGSASARKARSILKQSNFETDRIVKAFTSRKSYRIITLIGHKGSLEADFVQAAETTSKEARGCISELINQVSSGKEYGIAIFIDELGKYLENGNEDNCYFLQELAEAANRSQTRFLVVGILHQAFDAYASNLTKFQRDEWAKVQGRYVDLPILSAPDEVLQLLSRSIKSELDEIPTVINEPISVVIKEFSKTRNFDRNAMVQTFTSIYPLNPVTASMLGVISRHGFLQNTRSVFNFLTSKEPFSFLHFISATNINSSSLYNLDVLWDYLVANFEQAIVASATDGHRWAMASECIERARRLDSKITVSVTKTVAMFDLFKRGSGLECSENMICAALAPARKSQVQEALKGLIEAKIIVYRKYSNAYTLFEGTDFELDEELDKVLDQIVDIDVECVNRVLQLSPIIGRRHYAKTGTLRWFDRSVGILKNGQLQISKDCKNAGTGQLILCLGKCGQKDFESMISRELSIVPEQANYYALAETSETMLAKARELQALDTIENYSALEGDATARKEVLLRKELVTNQLIDELMISFTHAKWLGNGVEQDVKNMTDLVTLVSDICDKRFEFAPVINNELFNREHLSSNISRARKVLMEAMVKNENSERLGMQGYPPEVMLYLSMFSATNIHRKDHVTGHYRFVSDIEDPVYGKLWNATRDFFASNEKPTLAELYEFWGRAPFGLKAGIQPILALVYFLANSRELSIYVNNVIQPELSGAVLEHWHLDPKEIAFRYVSSSTEKSDLLEKLSAALNNFDGINCDSSPLSVARAIVRIVLTCPKWALTTSQLDKTTKEFRNTVIKAWDPLELIFQDLPRIFNTDNTDDLVQAMVKSLDEIASVTPQMLLRVRNFLFDAIDHDGDLDELHRRAKLIQNTAGQMHLEAFIARMLTFDASDAHTEGVIGLAVTKPKLQWTDRDIELALNKISDWSLSFRHLEGMNLLRNRENSRRVISMVVGGERGEEHEIIDLPTRDDKKIGQLNKELMHILKLYPSRVALCALIDQSIALLKERK